MKKDIAKLITVFLFLSVNIAVQAENNQTEGYFIVDSRPLSPEQRALMEKRRLEEQQLGGEVASGFNDNNVENAENSENQLGEASLPNSEQNSQDNGQTLTGIKIPIRTQSLINHTAAAVYSPYIYHTIHSFPQETIIKLEDGSEWIFDPKDSYIVRSWRARYRDPAGNENLPDTVVLAPKTSWFNWFSGSNYAYVLQNKDLGSSIDVNPFLGPSKEGEFTTWVIGLDFNLGQIYVMNGKRERSVWEISSSDYYLFKDWQVGDAIIFGENNDWSSWFSSFNHIIINVQMNHNVRARQISAAHFPKPREE